MSRRNLALAAVLALLALLAVIVTAPAFAQQPKRGGPEQKDPADFSILPDLAEKWTVSKEHAGRCLA
jgi:invasion protein IalB